MDLREVTVVRKPPHVDHLCTPPWSSCADGDGDAGGFCKVPFWRFDVHEPSIAIGTTVFSTAIRLSRR